MIKKITFLFLALLVSTFSWQGMAQVSIGEQDGTTSTIPIAGCWGYSYTQQIVYSSEINASGDITSISFYYTSGGFDNSLDWDIYLGHSTQTTFASTTDWVDAAGLEQVYSGTVTYPAAGNWMTITFDTPFSYNGTDHLVVAVHENMPGYTCSANFAKTETITGTNRGMTYRNDTTNPDPTSPPSASTRVDYINTMILGGIQQSCPSPTEVAASAITQTTADVNWTAGATETSWNLTWGLADYIPGDGNEIGQATVSTTSYQVMGLTPNTSYRVYVQADCGGEESAWIGYSFKTACGVVDTMVENFDSYDTGSIVPDCWERIVPAASAGSQTISSTSPASGTRNIYQYASATSNSIIVALPEFSNIDAGTHRLKLSARVGSGSGALLVGYVTDVTDYDSFTLIQEVSITNTSYATNSEYSVVVPNTVPAGARLGIKSAANGTSHYWDDVYWEVVPSCMAPSTLAATGVTDSTVDIDWMAGNTETSWNVSWGATGYTPGDADEVGTAVATATNFQITGLTAETAYDVYVQADCGAGDLSLWTGPLGVYTGYCIPTNTGDSGYIESVTITGDSGADISNLDSGAGITGSGYSDFSAQTVVVTPEETISYTVALESGETAGLKIWIDWNNDLTFDETTEMVYQSTSYSVNYTGSITMPVGASGNYRMRIGSSYTPNSGPANACAHTGQGEYEDYTINIATLDTCTEAVAGTVVGETEMEVCALAPFSMTVTGNSEPADGLTRTWQSSPAGAGTWTDLGVASSTITIAGIDVATDYRYHVECTNGDMDDSEIIEVTLNPNPSDCYCIPEGTNSARYIDNFSTTGGIENISNLGSGYAPNGYGDFTAMTLEGNPGDEISFTVDVLGGTAGFRIWVDWNTDGVFDTTEEVVYNSTSYSAQHMGSFTIPMDAASGDTRMRVVSHWLDPEGDIDPCETGFIYGEFEDYTLSVPGASGPFPSPYCDIADAGDVWVEEITSIDVDATNVITNTNTTDPLVDHTDVIVDFTAGQTYNLSVEGNTYGDFETNIVAFIDWNQNDMLDDAGEIYELGTLANSDGADGISVNMDILVPADAVLGETRIRITKTYFDDLSLPIVTPCGIQFDPFGQGVEAGYGQAIDFTLNILEGSTDDCTGTPDGGLATANPESGEANSAYTVSATGFTSANGITYQWQSNTDAAGWVNEGASSTTYADFMATAPATSGVVVEWRLEVTCGPSAESSYSSVATFTTIEPSIYCIPVLDCTDNDAITNVTFQEIDNTTTCSPSGYGDYTAMVATVQSGGTFPMSVTVGDGWNVESASVWIDFDNNGSFDENEFFYIGTGSGEVLTENIVIPADAADGDYRMRVRVAAVPGDSATWDLACDEDQGYGETEDYTVTVTSAAGYCIPMLDCSDDDSITNVTFEGIDNTTTCSVDGYGDYTAMAATVQSGGTFPISVSVGGGWDVESVSVWIDFDNSQTFDENEFFFIGTGSAEALTGDIAIPTGLANGDYRMRVRVAAVPGDSATWDLACDEDQGYGETEDYTVTVDGTVGVEDFSNLNFSYYPNPMSEVLYVTANQNIESVSAYNVLGQQVLNNNQFADGKVDVSSLPTGTFIFRVTFEGGLEENFKVVKE